MSGQNIASTSRVARGVPTIKKIAPREAITELAPPGAIIQTLASLNPAPMESWPNGENHAHQHDGSVGAHPTPTHCPAGTNVHCPSALALLAALLLINMHIQGVLLKNGGFTDTIQPCSDAKISKDLAQLPQAISDIYLKCGRYLSRFEVQHSAWTQHLNQC